MGRPRIVIHRHMSLDASTAPVPDGDFIADALAWLPDISASRMPGGAT